jgi:hypothetical protein
MTTSKGAWPAGAVVEGVVCGGLKSGDGGGFGCRGWLMFVLRDALAGGRRVVLHDFHDEVADNAGAFFSLGDFSARGEDA